MIGIIKQTGIVNKNSGIVVNKKMIVQIVALLAIVLGIAAVMEIFQSADLQQKDTQQDEQQTAYSETETSSQINNAGQEKAEIFKSNEWFEIKSGTQTPTYELFEAPNYGLTLKIAAYYDKILISYDSKTSQNIANIAKTKDIDLRVKFRNNGVILQNEIYQKKAISLGLTAIALPQNLPKGSEWQPEIIILSKATPVTTEVPSHKLT